MCNPVSNQAFDYELPDDTPAAALACPQCQRAVHFQNPAHIGQKCACGYFVRAAWHNGRPVLANPITTLTTTTAPNAGQTMPAQAGGWVVVDDTPRLTGAPNAARPQIAEVIDGRARVLPAAYPASMDVFFEAAVMFAALHRAMRESSRP